MLDTPRHRTSTLFGHIITVLFSSIAILLAVNQIFKLRILGFLPIENGYLYYLLACYLSLAFILFPATKNSLRDRIPWYDILLCLASVVINLYFATRAIDMIRLGWEYSAPFIPTLFSVMIWAMVIEAVRRTSGPPLAIVCLVFSFYPLYTGFLPGFLGGQDFNFLATATIHAMSINSILGVPLNVVGTLLIGFILFGVVLQGTGGGDFFLKISEAMFGQARGGPAKVAVVASSLFGSLSGSAISNVITTGSITIPTMKKTGYAPHYAAAIEACASTGGAIMPPVMGAAAFVMAAFMGRPYAEIVVAAIIPSLLYYMGLFFQIDTHAVKIGLKGLPKDELPSMKETLKEGWYFVFVLVVLFYFLFTLRVEAWAPFYASLMLIALSYFRRESRVTLKKLVEIIVDAAKVMTELTAILAAVGLIVGALSVTGVAFAFSRELVAAVGSNLILLLLAGAFTSFILGFGMTSTACYIFLAIVLAPALIKVGVDPMAAHFFVLYFGIVSFITPPVALAAYAAAGISGSDPMKTGFTAMRLGIITFIIPFMFVYSPALLGQGGAVIVIYSFITAGIGVYFISSALEAYLIRVGKLSVLSRVILSVGSLMLVTPEWRTDLAGVTVIAFAVLIARINNKSYLLKKTVIGK